MVMSRVPQWPRELSEFLKERSKMPFEWGKNDCLMFPADAVLRLTGFDPAAPWRGTYSTEKQALDLVKEYGGVAELINEGLGFKGTRNILTARRGDVVITKTEHGLLGGIVDDSGTRIAVPISNLNTVVRLPLQKTWRVWSY